VVIISWLVEEFVNGHGHQIHANTATGVEASTHTFFRMLGCAIIHASRFARKFAYEEGSGITSSCVVDPVQAHVCKILSVLACV
jgi:hypothetical protein